VASLSQGRTAAAQCGLFTHKSVPVIFEPPCSIIPVLGKDSDKLKLHLWIRNNILECFIPFCSEYFTSRILSEKVKTELHPQNYNFTLCFAWLWNWRVIPLDRNIFWGCVRLGGWDNHFYDESAGRSRSWARGYLQFVLIT